MLRHLVSGSRLGYMFVIARKNCMISTSAGASKLFPPSAPQRESLSFPQSLDKQYSIRPTVGKHDAIECLSRSRSLTQIEDLQSLPLQKVWKQFWICIHPAFLTLDQAQYLLPQCYFHNGDEASCREQNLNSMSHIYGRFGVLLKLQQALIIIN